MERLVETSRRVESRLKEGLYHCEKHAGKPVVLYCQTCSCLVCSTCIVSSHAGHQYEETDSAADELLKRLETKLGCSVGECVTQLRAKVTQINRVSKKAADDSRAKVFDHYRDIETLLVAHRSSVLSELREAAKEIQDLREQTNSFIGKLQSFSDLIEGKRRSLDVIAQCCELLQLPVEDVLSKEIDKINLSFEPSFKLFKLESKAVNLLGTVSGVLVEKQQQKVKGLFYTL